MPRRLPPFRFARPVRLALFARSLTAAVLVLLVVVLGAGVLFLRSTLPDTRGEVRLAGVAESVTVWRDRWGVPTVRAGSTRDAVEALGYLHASDRLWQMELRRRAAAGRLSEVFGRLTLQADLDFRRRNLTALAAEDWRLSTPAERTVLQAYADGVNAYLETHRWRLPPEFLLLRFRPEPWRPEDSLAFLRLMLTDLADSAVFERARLESLARLGPERAADLFTLQARFAAAPAPALDQLVALNALIPGQGGAQAGTNRGNEAGGDASPGSNGWVVPPQLSVSGGALVANDPHLDVQIPAVWYEAGLLSPDYEARGLTLAGLPFVAIGRGPHVAWGITVHPADDQDLFIERLDDSDPPRVLDRIGTDPTGQTEEVWVPMQRRAESIGVRGEQAVARSIDSTPRGVLIEPGKDSRASLALRAASSFAHGSFGLLLGLARAPGADAFVQALRPYDDTPLCVTFADDAGRTGLQTIGFVPVRARGDGSIPLAGWTDPDPWPGRVPFDSMFAVRPDAALDDARPLVAANDRLRPATEPDLYPGEWVAPARAERIAAVLIGGAAARRPFTIEDMRLLQDDEFSRRADATIPAMQAILARAGAEAPAGAARAMSALAAWDRRMGAMGPSLLWSQWLSSLQESFGGAASPFDSGTLCALVQREGDEACASGAREPSCGFDWFDDPDTPARETAPERLARTLDDAWTKTIAARGADPGEWDWAGVHAVTFEHPLAAATHLTRWLDLGPVGMPGGNDTVNVQIAPLRRGEAGWEIGHIPSARVLFEMSGRDTGLSVLPTGQSGHPFSRHYGDQLRLWAAGELHPAPFTETAARAAAVETLLLVP